VEIKDNLKVFRGIKYVPCYRVKVLATTLSPGRRRRGSCFDRLGARGQTAAAVGRAVPEH